MYKLTQNGVRVTIVNIEEQNITYSECVSVALVIQHAMRMRCIILSLVEYQALLYLFALTYKRNDFRENKLLNVKCVLIFPTTFVETLLVLRKTERYMIINVTHVFM